MPGILVARSPEGKRISLITSDGDPLGSLPADLEIAFQFEKNGTYHVYVEIENIIHLADGDKLTYKADGLEMTLLENGKANSVFTFSSPNPKKGDKILFPFN